MNIYKRRVIAIMLLIASSATIWANSDRRRLLTTVDAEPEEETTRICEGECILWQIETDTEWDSIEYRFGDGGLVRHYADMRTDSAWHCYERVGVMQLMAIVCRHDETGAVGRDTLRQQVTVESLAYDTTTTDTCAKIYVWRGESMTEGGTYTRRWSVAGGCDSIAVLQLTLRRPPEARIEGAGIVCGDESTVLTASEGASYQWSTGATTQSIEVGAGEYGVSIAYDDGCISQAHTRVAEQQRPEIEIQVEDLCWNRKEIHVGYQPEADIHIERGTSTLGHAERIFLPDGVECTPYGCSYRSMVRFTDFEEGAVIRTADDIHYLRLNIEHSYAGDLYINITCPNGQEADILRFGGSPSSDCASEIGAAHRGWDESSSTLSSSTRFGIPNQTNNANAKCDSAENPAGVGWNYCWSNNTDQGYQYGSGDGRIYRAGNALGGSFDSSNVMNHTHFYHPDDTFGQLVGCPLNGEWYIEVIDGWGADNGYVFGWELALAPDLLPEQDEVATIVRSEIEGLYVSTMDDSTFVIEPPDTVEDGTILQYRVRLYDTTGCEYDTSFSLTFHPSREAEEWDSVCDDALPYLWNGYELNETTAQTYRTTTAAGCDSAVTLHLTVNTVAHTDIADSVCPGEGYSFGGQTRYGPGSYVDETAYRTEAGCDSVVTLHLTERRPPETHIYGDSLVCQGERAVLTASEGDSYLWNTGETTQSIMVGEGQYSVTIGHEEACTGRGSHQVSTLLRPKIDILLNDSCSRRRMIHVGYHDTDDIRIDRGTSALGHRERIFLPDGVECTPYGCSYRSMVEFTDFEEGAVIRTADDIHYVQLNMEHSFAGDLYINITCPNGQEADILRFGGSPSSDCASEIGAAHRGWDESGSNVQSGTNFGIANSHDNTSDKCDSTINPAGTGWNYCWSNNTNQGYQYGSGDGRIYRAGNAQGGSFDSSDVMSRTHFYHPDETFASLVGCPLNGEWYIEVIDGWGVDNGYVFGWELALEPDLLPARDHISTIVRSEIEGPYSRTENDSTFVIELPEGLSHDTTAEYRVRLYDTQGCEYDTSFSLSLHSSRQEEERVSICDDELPYVWNGYELTETTTQTHTTETVGGCDSVVTLHLTVNATAHKEVKDSICQGSSYSFGGRMLRESGVYVDSTGKQTAEGCDSVVVLELTVKEEPHIDVLVDHECRKETYHLTARTDGTYYYWTANGVRMADTAKKIEVQPREQTEYMFHADYRAETFCHNVRALSLIPLVQPKAKIEIRPRGLSVDALHYRAVDIGSGTSRREWYVDEVLEGSGETLEGNANRFNDSMVVMLRAENYPCNDTDIVVVPIDHAAVYVPNAFTPEQETSNRFEIKGNGIIECSVRIYDRKGLLVYSTEDYREAWDGSLKGQPCQGGAYVYKLHYRLMTKPEQWQEKVGTVTLIR